MPLIKGVWRATWPLTTRPGFPGTVPALDGDFLTDEYSRISYQRVEADGPNVWRPVGTTRGAVDFWLDPAAGSDANDGAFATPLQTLQGMIERLPHEINDEINVHFIDGGNPLLIDEQIRISDLHLRAGINIIGNTRPAVLPMGPNVVAPNPANVGDYWGLIVPAAAWIPRSLIGLQAMFTAGPRAGTSCYIIDNGVNTVTFGFRDSPLGGGPFGPADGFDLYENLETIQLSTGAFQFPTMTISNVVGEAIEPTFLDFTFLKFKDVTIGGDNTFSFSILFNGNCHVSFERCCIADYVGSFTPGSVNLLMLDGMTWSTRAGVPWSLFDPFPFFPGGSVNVVMQMTGVLGGIYVGNRTNFQAYDGNFLSDVALPLAGVLHYFGDKAEMSNVGVDGLWSSDPMILMPGAYGMIDLKSVDFERGFNSGIGPMERNKEIGNIVLRVDYGAPFPSEFQWNPAYGIEATGLKVHLWGAVASTMPNGTAGMRLRKGGFLMVNGALPSLNGPAPGTNIDFDDRGPPWFTSWGEEATGLETLCHQQPQPPM